MENVSLKEVRYQQYNSSEIPLVSVATIAYNVGAFIEEAIESVLSQQTFFNVELIIGEDCSTDSTREIVLNYQKEYPNIIRVLAHEKNLGLTPNSVATQNACRGKYIALLDGDDYWTDVNKLQKQVTFLENNPDYSACAHQSYKIYDDGSSVPILFGEEIDKDYAIEDTITHRKFHTSALVYRRIYWVESGGIPATISSNERAIYPMLAIYGKIRYMKDNMCIYRLSGVGLSSRINYKELETDLAMLPWLKSIDRNFPVLKFRSFLHLCMFTYGAKIPFMPLAKHFFYFFVFSFSYFPKNMGDLKWGIRFFIRRVKC